MTISAVPCYAGNRFPAETISLALGPCFRFPLSLSAVVELLAVRGIIVHPETARKCSPGLARGSQTKAGAG